MKATAATTVLPVVAGSLLLPRTARGEGASTLKIGLIGCGGRGTGAATQALHADANTVLYAMGDVFADRLQGSLDELNKQMSGNADDTTKPPSPEQASNRITVPAERQFTGFDAFQKVIDSGVDVVILTTPPGFRPMHLKAAVEAGKHVFCEKPVAVDAPGIRSVLASADIAKQKHLALVAGFCWRYSNAERAAFKQVHDGAIGDVVSVHTTYHTGTLSARPRQPEWSDMEWQLRNWWHFTWLSGDHIVEQACHSIDRLAWAVNDKLPVRCNALGGRAARKGAESGHVFDHFTVIYEYDNGMRCFHTCRQIDNCPSDNTDYIYGTKGSCTVNGFKPQHEIRDPAGKVVWSYDGPRPDMYQNEHDELFASIRAGSPFRNELRNGGPLGTPINNGVWMANSTMMALMGRMAAYTGQTITWEQAMDSQENLSPAKYEMGSMPIPPVAVPGQTKFV